MKFSRSVMLFCACALFGAPAHSVNSEFQDFFFQACAGSTGGLAARCGETDASLGNLSGDSESSLNPSQALGLGISGEGASRLREQRPTGTGSDNDVAEPSARIDIGRFSLLFHASGAQESFDRAIDLDEERSYDNDTKILQAGLDYRLNDRVQVGAMVHWQATTLDYDRELPGQAFTPTGRAGQVEQHALGGSVFTSIAVGERSYLDLTAGYLGIDYDIERRALFQESNRVVPTTAVVTTGSTNGTEVFAGAHWGLSLSRNAWQFGPYLGLDYLKRDIDGYAEKDSTNSGLALRVTDTEYKEARLTAGWQTSLAISGDGYVVLPQLKAEYVKHLDQDSVAAAFTLLEDAAGARLDLRGDKREADYFELGVGAVALFKNGWSAFIEWRTVVGRGDYERSNIAAGLRIEL